MDSVDEHCTVYRLLQIYFIVINLALRYYCYENILINVRPSDIVDVSLIIMPIIFIIALEESLSRLNGTQLI